MKRSVPVAESALLLAALLAVGSMPDPLSSQRTPDVVRPQHILQAVPVPPEDGLRLPERSARIANYTMDVTLDPSTAVISGHEVLRWINTTGRPQSTFPFHLYHNAWKNNRSTYAVEQGWDLGRRDMTPDQYGYTNVLSADWVTGRDSVDLMPSFRFVSPDDGNPDDQTVFEISTPRPIPPGDTLVVRIGFETKQPAPIDRTGRIRDHHFVVQWFPKIGVFWNGAWNCHQFHADTEFFADFGVYDVRLTVPSSYVVGATGGIPRETVSGEDGRTTYRFVQEDVHDFAWLAAPGLVVTRRTFTHREREPGERPDRHHPLRDVEVIVITQPHRSNAIERYFDATFKALRYYGEWYGEYPYETVTVVDPANNSRSGGMEYPTFFTGGTTVFAPRKTPSPESVTVHEFGHQFWYGLVANNEFEEAWLDEGFNTYSQDRVLLEGWGVRVGDPDASPWRSSRSYFGGPGAGTYVGIPYVWDDMPTLRMNAGNAQVRQSGKTDPMARKGWEYLGTYGLNSYIKPALSLHTLERYVGEDAMYRIMRTYHHRFRFRHPTSNDFIGVVNEVMGDDYTWFFRQTWFSSDVFDYAITSVTNAHIPLPAGLFGTNSVDAPGPGRAASVIRSTVVVQRLGEAIAPVDILVTFADESTRIVEWDGRDRWKKLTYDGDVPLRSAIVDPYRRLLLDIDWVNNSRVAPEFAPSSPLAARKWGSRFLFWVQTFLDMTASW